MHRQKFYCVRLEEKLLNTCNIPLVSEPKENYEYLEDYVRNRIKYSIYERKKKKGVLS